MPPDGAPDALLERLLSGIAAGDFAVLEDTTTPDVYFEAVTGDRFAGRETVEAVLADTMGGYDDFDLEIEWAIAEGDRVAAAASVTARPTRGIFGMPPPEGRRTIRSVFDGRLEDGRIAHLRQTLDTRQMMPLAARRGRGAVFEGMREAVIVLDERDRVVDANPAALDLVGTDREGALGESVDALLGTPSLDLDCEARDLTVDDRHYELRPSPVDVDGETVGHVLVARDVTERERRARRLAAQRDELERLETLNGVLRGVNRALVGAGTREEIERAVVDHLVETGRFAAACIGDVPTWTEGTGRWTAAGSDEPTSLQAPSLATPPGARSDGGAAAGRTVEPEPIDPDGPPVDDWTVVPLGYGATVYGGLGLRLADGVLGERERAVLGELGETIGHAINAVETRRLLSATATARLELASTDDGDPLVAATTDRDARLHLEGLVPVSEGRHLLYLSVTGGDVDDLAGALDEHVADCRTVRATEDGAQLAMTITEDAPLRVFVESGAQVVDAEAADGRATYDLRVAADAELRRLLDRARRRFPGIELVAKAESEGPVDTPAAPSPAAVTGLTDRQREAVETAYREGYFEWPREATAEEVAEALDVAPSTLHAHLRKAESALLGSVLDDETGADR